MVYSIIVKGKTMRVINLASGSKGNCTFIEAGNTKILLDAGLSVAEIIRRLDLINEKPENIDAVLVTHEHTDHIKGLASFLKKYNARGYIHEKVYESLKSTLNLNPDRVSTISKYSFGINDVRIMPFELPHDSIRCVGYMLEYKNSKVSFATDLGYMPDIVLDLMKGSALVYIESNHDVKLLRQCAYPYIVKQRIMGDNGHLSNEQASKVILELAKSGTKHFVLSHISENSNTLEQAYLTNARALEDAGFILEKDVFLRYSRQDRPGNNYRFGD